MKPAVIVDIDDTLADTQAGLLPYVNARASRHYEFVDLTRSLREDEHTEYWRLAQDFLLHPELVMHQASFPGGVAAIKKLLAAGYRVHFASARKSPLHQLTLDWLKNNGLTGDDIFVHNRPSDIRGAGFKLAVAKETDAIAAFDDTYNVAEVLTQAGIDMYLLDKPWNHDEPPLPGLHRVVSLDAGVDEFLADIKKSRS